jgi:DNA-binding protein H-NS
MTDMTINYAALEKVKTLRAQLAEAEAEAEEAEKMLAELADKYLPHKNGKGRADKGIKKEAKYRDPKNPENTWTGLGAMPKWLANGYYKLAFSDWSTFDKAKKEGLAEPFLITKALTAQAIDPAVRAASKRHLSK